MRKVLAVLGVMVAISLQATTPELGKDQLRKLLKLPTLNFQPSWYFEAESGFTLGSSEHEATNKFSELVKSLKNDNSDAEIYLQLAELHQSFHHAANARAAFSRAADLFRERVDSQPSDARLLADFGCALEGAEKRSEEHTSELQSR